MQCTCTPAYTFTASAMSAPRVYSFSSPILTDHCYSAAMPPKGSQVQPHWLGNVLQETHDGITSLRLRAKPNCRHEYGPRRTTKAAAEADLVAARQATTHEQCASIVRDLCARARGGAHLSRKKAQISRPGARTNRAFQPVAPTASWAHTCLPVFVCVAGYPVLHDLHSSQRAKTYALPTKAARAAMNELKGFGQFQPYEPDKETFVVCERRVNTPPPGRMPPRWPTSDFVVARASDH